MKNILSIASIACIFFFISCTPHKWLDRRVSLWRLDKIPYGTKYAYENLSSIFPEADIRTTSNFPIIFQKKDDSDRSRVLMIIGPRFKPEPDEMTSIIHFAAKGNNQVFISAFDFGDTVLSMLHLKVQHYLIQTGDSAKVSLFDPVNKKWIQYFYPGYTNGAFFHVMDTGHAVVLGKDEAGNADFIRISYARGGAIYIHLNPFTFTNFFLLHKSNKTYYDIALSYLPKRTDVLEWSDYFRYSRQGQRFSAFRFILRQRSLRWAFWLTISLFILIFIIETKRRQRPISEIPVLRNASEDFVKTVGRLYYQQKDNQNLAFKMIAAFLETVRQTYRLSTSYLDEEFALKLANRSGRQVDQIRQIIHLIHDARLHGSFSDQELMNLHQQINQFNKPI